MKVTDNNGTDYSILEGSVDLHFHSAPSLFARVFEHDGAIKECMDLKMKAVVLKDHFYYSFESINFIMRYLQPDYDFHVFGGMALNNSVGGLNPYAVELGVKAGVKIIWMPTLSAENHIRQHNAQQDCFLFPRTSERLLQERGLTVLQEDGRLKPEVHHILEILAQYPEVILATGHLSYREALTLLKQARSYKIERMLVNHPTFTMDCTIEELKALVKEGAYIEHSAGMIHPDSQYYSIPKEKLITLINEVGIEKTILSSDLGQANNPRPAEGIRYTAQLLQQNGFEEKAISKLIAGNAAGLLGI